MTKAGRLVGGAIIPLRLACSGHRVLCFAGDEGRCAYCGRETDHRSVAIAYRRAHHEGGRGAVRMAQLDVAIERRAREEAVVHP